MRNFQPADTTWRMWVGLVLSVVGIGLYGVAGEEALEWWTVTATYAGCLLACSSGLCLICNDLFENLVLPQERLTKSEGNFLGRFRLNSYSFAAYERDGANGVKQLRLVSSTRVSAQQEAACIRYMVNEGLIEEFWPEMSKKINEEADWAFLA